VTIFKFSALKTADLVVDAIYEGGNAGNLGDDPISKLIPGIGNQGGFRISGKGSKKNLIILYTSNEQVDWPNTLDLNTGMFVYYGDNREPGRRLHDTQGNQILRDVFNSLHTFEKKIDSLPIFLIFSKKVTEYSSRSVQFRGLAVPGYPGMPSTEDLVAVWKTKNNQRFQNYKATFTILNIPFLSRTLIEEITKKNYNTDQLPSKLIEWLEKGKYDPLISKSTVMIRTINEQMPKTNEGKKILTEIFNYFSQSSHAFEFFAAHIFCMSDKRALIDEVTRRSIDGGRDAIGRYQLGLISDPVYAEFSLEAKCYRPQINEDSGNTVGVKEVARLISRLRHLQFGVLVTTSAISSQAYKEVRDDKHPIIFISGTDIVDILANAGISTLEMVKHLLKTEFPLN
jgi:hypothetical protein